MSESSPAGVIGSRRCGSRCCAPLESNGLRAHCGSTNLEQGPANGTGALSRAPIRSVRDIASKTPAQQPGPVPVHLPVAPPEAESRTETHCPYCALQCGMTLVRRGAQVEV